MKTNSCRRPALIKILAIVIIGGLLLSPACAFAANSKEAYEVFSKEELSKLLEETKDLDSCEFVMHDFKTGENSYLKIREKYADRYLELVGEDSVRPLSNDEDNQSITSNILPGMPLEELSYPGYGTWSPWRDVLSIRTDFSQPQATYISSAFLVSSNIVITAAHCVMLDGVFAYECRGESSVGTQWYEHPQTNASIALVQKEWLLESSQGIYDHDFAILIFDNDIEGSSEEGDFGYESVTAAETLTMTINCAGYLNNYEQMDGIHLWKNENNGHVLLVESLPVSGNDFAIHLSVAKGMSGGPVYRIEDGRFIAIGILSHMNTGANLSYACRITERLQALIAWAKESGFKNTASTSVTPSSPATGVNELSSKKIASQIAEQFSIQSTSFEEMPKAFIRARSINPEICAWLYISGTSISLPIARHEGNDSYYLSHNYQKEDSPLGCVYMEEADSSDFNQPLTILYGHSFLNNPLALTGLHAFEDLDFFTSHSDVYVLTKNGLLTYRVVEAALYTGSHISNYTNEFDSESFQEYVDDFADTDPKGFVGYRIPTTLNAETDQILQLSTCTVPATKEARFVVTAVLAK